MAILGGLLSGIATLAQLVCLILVIVKMFQMGDTTMGIVCIVTSFCCGIGVLITFVYGWIKAKEWNLTNIMIIWSVAWGVGILGYAMNPSQFQFQIQR